MPVSIEVCIPSRDGRIDDNVLMRAHAACDYAARRGTPCNLARVTDRYTVATCRNRGVAGFLSREQFTHLLFLDDDVLLPAPALATLAETAADYPDDIVSGCIPSIRVNDLGDVAPYIQIKPVGGTWLTTWPRGLVEADAVGGGCMLIPRPVFAALEFPWFRWPETYRPGVGVRAVTDDADFCGRVRGLGRRVWGDHRVRCGHMKTLDVASLIPE